MNLSNYDYKTLCFSKTKKYMNIDNKNRLKRLGGMVIIGLALTFSACNDFLTVVPKSELTAESFWQTERDANVGVIAIYNAFSGAMSSGVWDWGEIRGDNFTYYEKDAPDQRELIENNILIDNPAALWTTLYDVIGKANAAIKYIPAIEMTPSLKNHYLAEAYALRAWAYFYGIRVWGDMPLYLEPIEEVNQGIYRPRTDKNNIIDNVIIPDLEKAYFFVNKSTVGRTRINVGTVCVLLMDVYAWVGNYDLVARIKEERVNKLDNGPDDRISNSWLYLMPGGTGFAQNWRSLFIESAAAIPKEVWFKVSYDRFGNGVNNGRSYFGTGSSKLTISSKLAGIYETSDIRRAAQWTGTTTLRFNRKFWPDGTAFSGSNAVVSENDLVMYRYADVVLLYAEALNALGRTQEAINELNKTRVRAGNLAFSVSDFSSQDQILDAILVERQKEFVGEGKRWFDLVRTKRWALHTTLTDADKVVFPVHRDHLVQNPELTQNFPAYPYP